MDRWYVKLMNTNPRLTGISGHKHRSLNCRMLVSTHNMFELLGELAEHIPACKICSPPEPVSIDINDIVRLIKNCMMKRSDGTAIVYMSKQDVAAFEQIYREVVHAGH